MYAWRARIGLVKPTHRGKSFAFWYKYAADGVEIVPTFIGFRSGHKEKFLEGFQRAEEIAVQLKEVGCDIITIGQYLRPSRLNLPVQEYLNRHRHFYLKSQLYQVRF